MNRFLVRALAPWSFGPDNVFWLIGSSILSILIGMMSLMLAEAINAPPPPETETLSVSEAQSRFAGQDIFDGWVVTCPVNATSHNDCTMGYEHD